MHDSELELYTVNDGFLYRTVRRPIEATLTQLQAAGTYRHADALRRYVRLAEQGAQRYLREFPGSPRFTRGEIEEAAKGMLQTFEVEHRLGNMRHHIAPLVAHPVAAPVESRKTPGQLERDIARLRRRA